MWRGRDRAFSSDVWQQRAEWGDDALAREPHVRILRERPDTGGSVGISSAPSKYISGDPRVADANEYNVQINFLGSWSADLRQAFVTCAETVSDLITGDVPNIGKGRTAIDDIVITASLSGIDG